MSDHQINIQEGSNATLTLKTGGTYTPNDIIIDIVGTQGLQGYKGIQGTQGYQGLQGYNGTNGSNFIQSLTGAALTLNTYNNITINSTTRLRLNSSYNIRGEIGDTILVTGNVSDKGVYICIGNINTKINGTYNEITLNITSKQIINNGAQGVQGLQGPAGSGGDGDGGLHWVLTEANHEALGAIFPREIYTSDTTNFHEYGNVLYLVDEDVNGDNSYLGNGLCILEKFVGTDGIYLTPNENEENVDFSNALTLSRNIIIDCRYITIGGGMLLFPSTVQELESYGFLPGVRYKIYIVNYTADYMLDTQVNHSYPSTNQIHGVYYAQVYYSNLNDNHIILHDRDYCAVKIELEILDNNYEHAWLDITRCKTENRYPNASTTNTQPQYCPPATSSNNGPTTAISANIQAVNSFLSSCIKKGVSSAQYVESKEQGEGFNFNLVDMFGLMLRAIKGDIEIK